MGELFWLLISGCVFIFSFLLCVLLVPFAFVLARRFRIMDHPSDRKVHALPMPRTGGFAIFLSFVLTILISLFLFDMLYKIGFNFFPKSISDIMLSNYRRLENVLPVLRVIIFAGTAIFVIGLWDDLRPLNFRGKLFMEILVAGALWWNGIRMTIFLDNPIISFILTVLWIVGITNSFNLLDNMDGLSAGVAFVISCMFFVFCFREGQFFVSLILVVMMGITAGFLIFNFPPAKIFMGDSGSLFIGLILSCISLVASYYGHKTESRIAIVMPLLLFAVPIFDTLSVIWIRIKEGRSIFSADKKHFSHRLTCLGMTQKQAVLFIYLVVFCLGAGAVVLKDLNVWTSYWILIQAIAILTIIVLLENAGKNARR